MSTAAARPARPPRPSRSELVQPEGFEMLDQTHRDVMVQLSRLGELIDHLDREGVDERARELARSIADFFNGHARQHHAEEEARVFPGLLGSGDAELVGHVRRCSRTTAGSRKTGSSWRRRWKPSPRATTGTTWTCCATRCRCSPSCTASTSCSRSRSCIRPPGTGWQRCAPASTTAGPEGGVQGWRASRAGRGTINALRRPRSGPRAAAARSARGRRPCVRAGPAASKA